VATAELATGARTLHVEPCMGTVFSIDIRDPGDWTEAVGAAVAWLHHVDAVFSTFKPASDVSRIRRRELRVSDADPLVGEVLDLCADMTRETGGYFTARLGGLLDPTGLVKGWAIEQASRLLGEYGAANHAVNGGGDVQLAGFAEPGVPWVVGIADPFDPARTVTTVAGSDLAIATSGTAERGAHIINPFTNRSPADLASVTVVGPDLTRADAYATAAFAMGYPALEWLDSLAGYEGVVVTADGRLVDRT
jgi:thiamine biosynthesis lipoprotein